MIEDMTHLAVLSGMNQEILDLVSHFNARASGKTDKQFLLGLRIEENNQLTDLLARQRRALDYMSGRYVAPQNHTVEAVLIGRGQGVAS